MPHTTERSTQLQELRKQAEQFAQDNLAQCAAEMLVMADTGRLPDGKVRELSRMCLRWSSASSALPLAQSLVHRCALEAVVKAGASESA